MPEFVLGSLERKQRYKLIAGAIIPRPIALVTTLDADGRCNAAPFSAFNYVSEDPPLIVLGLQVHPDGSPQSGEEKDTTRNIRANGELVVHLVDEPMFDAMVHCAVDFPAGTSETEAVGLRLAPSRFVKPPRLADAPFALECRVAQTLDVSTFRTIAICEVISVWARDGLVDPKTLNIDLSAYQPIGRLTGASYCRTGDTIRKPIPTLSDFLIATGKQNPGSANEG